MSGHVILMIEVDRLRLVMIVSAHVCGCHPEPGLAARHPAARELPRGRQDQEPNPRQPVALAGRAHRPTARRAARRQTARRAARRQTAARHGGGRNRPLAAARPRDGGARHRAPHRARRRAAAPGAATPVRSGIGPDRRPPARTGGQAGDRTNARSRHRQPFAGRDAGAGPRRGQGGLCRAQLAGPRAAVHRSRAGPPSSEGWRAAALRCHLHLSRRTLLRTGAAWLQPRPPG